MSHRQATWCTSGIGAGPTPKICLTVPSLDLEAHGTAEHPPTNTQVQPWPAAPLGGRPQWERDRIRIARAPCRPATRAHVGASLHIQIQPRWHLPGRSANCPSACASLQDAPPCQLRWSPPPRRCRPGRGLRVSRSKCGARHRGKAMELDRLLRVRKYK